MECPLFYLGDGNYEIESALPLDHCGDYIGCIVNVDLHAVRLCPSNFQQYARGYGLVILRVEREIIQKMPAGQYYESLFFKHNDEIMQISFNHPEKEEEFWRVTRL